MAGRRQQWVRGMASRNITQRVGRAEQPEGIAVWRETQWCNQRCGRAVEGYRKAEDALEAEAESEAERHGIRGFPLQFCTIQDRMLAMLTMATLVDYSPMPFPAAAPDAIIPSSNHLTLDDALSLPVSH